MSETWHFTPSRSVHWDVQFFPVLGKECNPVIVIYIAGMRNLGGIFTKCPKSFELQIPSGSDEEKIVCLNFDQWEQRMLRGTCLGESKGMEKARAKLNTLDILKGPLLTVRGSVQRIRRAFFKVGPGCPVSPEGFERNLPETAKQVIQQIQQQCSGGRNCSLLVASHSWSSCIKKAEDCSKEDGVICDLLLFDQEKGVHLFTLCNSESEAHLSYAQNTAKALKNALVVEGDCHEKFYVTCHVVPCCSTTHVGPLSNDSRYPTVYQLKFSRGKVNQILRSLVIVLAQVPSILSNKQGISFFNLLTAEQFQLLYQEIDRHRELWIKGAAGTGKTVVAAEFIRELQRRDTSLGPDNILYVCENIGIRRKIRKLGICECVCRRLFMIQSFPEVKHVILDEVQNYRAEDGNWLEKARKLVRQHSLDHEHDSSLGPDLDNKLDCSPDSDSNSGSDSDSVSYIDPDPKLSTQFGTDIQPYPKLPTTDHIKEGPGFLWLFTDANQINHKFPTGIPDKNQQHPSFHLTKVIRNTKIISSLAKKFLSNDAAKEIEMGHDFNGERAVRKKYSRGQQIAALRNVLHLLLEEGYSEGDIAILFWMDGSIPKENLSSRLNLAEIVDADCNDSECVVVSTFRKYSGLERPVVILVNITGSLPYGSLPEASCYCAVTRAMVKLVFLQEKKGRKRKHQPN